MEGKYTKLGAVIALFGLVITIWQVLPNTNKNIDGEWTMTSKIKEADLKKYIGMEIRWRVFLTENGQKLKGTAEKVAINNSELDYNFRTTMDLEGNIKDDIITINYIEYGKIRKTSGVLILTLEDDKFVGYFSQTASNTKGDVIGIKLKK